MILELKGHVPSKANDYRRGRKGGLYLPPGTAMELAGLQLQLNVLWSGKNPLLHPEVTIELYTANPSQDRDNQVKSLCDLMQKCGVIENDSARKFNGWLHIAPTVISQDEKVLIEIK